MDHFKYCVGNFPSAFDTNLAVCFGKARGRVDKFWKSRGALLSAAASAGLFASPIYAGVLYMDCF